MKKIKLGRYRHFKGNLYEVIDVVHHSETLEEMVLYKDKRALWVRPLKMFLENVVVNGIKVPRFKYLGDQ